MIVRELLSAVSGRQDKEGGCLGVSIFAAPKRKLRRSNLFVAHPSLCHESRPYYQPQFSNTNIACLIHPSHVLHLENSASCHQKYARLSMDKLIGQRFSLISKSEIRYVGTLHEINPE